MNQILIYTEKDSPRLNYTFDLVLSELLGLGYTLCHNEPEFLDYRGPKFAYHKSALGDAPFFEAAKLLFEEQIQPQVNELIERGELCGLFRSSEKSVLPFDVFASAFFLVTRYEEYLAYKKDKFGRYRAGQSTAKIAGFLERPMVNHYSLVIKEILAAKFPELVFRTPTFSYLPTFDIDMAYSYAHKGFQRNLGGFLRGFFFSDFQDIKNRFLVLCKFRKDPFDTFDYTFKILGKFNLRSVFFFLLADHSKFDKNISYENESFIKLVQEISSKTETGIHLSYKVRDKRDLLETEKRRLERITGKPAMRNRYHYLRFDFPISFARLVKHGITEDYSLGYAIRPGYRASICSPFLFFNLRENEVTNLRLFPFAFMDTTLNAYNKLEPAEALRKIRRLMENAHAVGGTFIGLWHNSSLCELPPWKGWREVFESAAEYAAELSNRKSE